MISVDNILNNHLPQLQQHPLLSKGIRGILRRLFHEQRFKEFADKYAHLDGFPFVEQALDYFAFSYALRDNERERIPAQGKVVIIANHPIGSLDGLALLNMVGSIRRDVKIVANDMLNSIKPLQQLLLPVTIIGSNSRGEQIQAIHQHLDQEGAVIIFPAGEVSRLSPKGVKDGKWQNGFLRIASKAKAPIVPVHIDGRNSALFYGASMLYKPLATLLLVHEMFVQHSKSIGLRIGHPIPWSHYSNLPLETRAKIRLFRRHLYRLENDKTPLFKTETAIAHPVDRSELAHSVRHCELLGETPDGKQIRLFQGGLDTPVLREVGRLREISFRAVGEGSGHRRDLDRFDAHYDHLLLWDPQALEIVGAYRMLGTDRVYQTHGLGGLYSHTLFEFDDALLPELQQGLELGRSFVQPRYWGKRSLDYLWYGIGAYLTRYPQYRYLFGPVSISKDMPPAAKDLMIHFYRTYFGTQEGNTERASARSRNPYLLAASFSASPIFSGQDYAQDFMRLKDLLANMNCSIPTLYKQYSEVAEPGGVRFLDFGIDPDFSSCIDGLVMVDIQQLKPHRRERYMPNFRNNQAA